MFLASPLSGVGVHRFLPVALAGLATIAVMTPPARAAVSAADPPAHPGQPAPACDADNAGLTLGPGFCATVFATGLGSVRQLTVTPDGRLYAGVANARDGSTKGGVVGLVDADGDGRAERIERFGDDGGNGVYQRDGQLWFAMNSRVVRYQLDPDALTPSAPPETVVSGLPDTGDHIDKTVVVDPQGKMYLNIGSGTNACQVDNRAPFSPGQLPCPELDVRAGVWRFSATQANQTPADGVRYVTGTRNMVALALQPGTAKLFGVQNGRDQLYENWPDRYTPEDDLVLPAEELFRLRPGPDYGWPYCYFDPQLDQNVAAPEYGGDGTTVGRCASAARPLLTFPAHWAPLSMTFTPDDSPLPEAYHRGAFVASHGSRFDPTTQPEGPGYNVVFVPFDGARPAGDWTEVAQGFAGTTEGLPESAQHRPVGTAVGPDGALYVSDDRGGYIYRIVWTGSDDDTTDHEGGHGGIAPGTPTEDPGAGSGAVQAGVPTPEMQGVLDAIASFNAPPIPSLTPQAARNRPSVPDWAAAASATRNVADTPEPVADVRHVVIPTADGDQLLARVYIPEGKGPRPVLAYYHGGGWVLANLSTYDASARALANASGAIVVSVAYRLAPESKFPTAAVDAYTAYLWIVDHAPSFGGDPRFVSVGGESAGGNLAAEVVLRARDEGGPMPDHQLLIYPVTNFDFDTPSYATYANAVPLDKASMQWFWDKYLPDPSAGNSAKASPLRAPSLAGLPPATVILAEIDPLQSEGAAYAQRLADAGVATTSCLYRGVTHEFFGLGALLPEAKAAQAAAGAGLKGQAIDQAACRLLTPDSSLPPASPTTPAAPTRTSITSTTSSTASGSP